MNSDSFGFNYFQVETEELDLNPSGQSHCVELEDKRVGNSLFAYFCATFNSDVVDITAISVPPTDFTFRECCDYFLAIRIFLFRSGVFLVPLGSRLFFIRYF